MKMNEIHQPILNNNRMGHTMEDFNKTKTSDFNTT